MSLIMLLILGIIYWKHEIDDTPRLQRFYFGSWEVKPWALCRYMKCELGIMFVSIIPRQIEF